MKKSFFSGFRMFPCLPPPYPRLRFCLERATSTTNRVKIGKSARNSSGVIPVRARKIRLFLRARCKSIHENMKIYYEMTFIVYSFFVSGQVYYAGSWLSAWCTDKCNCSPWGKYRNSPPECQLATFQRPEDRNPVRRTRHSRQPTNSDSPVPFGSIPSRPH